jgi:adenine-specific DNA-methyltransferase
MLNDGQSATWGAVPGAARAILDEGFLRLGDYDAETKRWSIHYVRGGDRKRIEEGIIAVVGERPDGSKDLAYVDVTKRKNFPKTVWNRTAHDATAHGTRLLKELLPGRKFPFPKALYAVEDVLRFFVADKPDAIILDFFSGSGTTAHAVMRLNKQDGGRRRAIIVTNNEVSAEEQAELRDQNLRPGDVAWERRGICEFITNPRITAAVTGLTPERVPIKGDYKFTDEFPMADGFEENVEFFTLTYEAPLRVASNREFARIAPLLWMRAGFRGRRINDISGGWDVTDAYGVLADLDQTDAFLAAIEEAPDAAIAFVVTNEDRLFEAVVRELPESVEPVRLYEAYLRNFEIETGRSSL